MKSPHSNHPSGATPTADRSSLRVLAAGLVAVMVLTGITLPALAGPNPALEAEIKKLVDTYRTENKIPGLTVSVTRNGVPLFAQGYGQATDTKPMSADHRSLIGSVTKATITGPAGYQAIKNSRTFTLNSKLYGNGGVFGQKFATDLTMGVQRHTPIVGMAVAKDGRVYTWYANDTFSVGTPKDLAKHQPPVAYVPAKGRKASEIIAMSFKSDGKVVTWYRKGELLTRSIGSITDLDAHSPETIPCDPDNPVPRCHDIHLAGKQNVYNIVGIALRSSKTGDRTVTWHDDGTVSEGDWNDLDAHGPATKFTTPNGLMPYDLRELDFGADGKVHAWYRNGRTSVGEINNLGSNGVPAAYVIPEAGYSGGENWYPWYANITLQHLLRHEAGFTNSGDGRGAALMFGKPLSTLTYEEGHRHFLRTRPLLSAPGKYSYSNHGFGLWTLLMPTISGQSYLDYVVGRYLKPMGLDDDVIPASDSPDALDAAGYVVDGNGKFIAQKFEPADSLAAGGWRASARSLTAITANLDARFSPTELVNMGWQTRKDGRLVHYGALTGGMAVAMIFPEKYVSENGQDMGGLHVAMASNIRNDHAPQGPLAFQIAERVAKEL